MVGGSAASGLRGKAATEPCRRGPPARTVATLAATVALVHAWLIAEVRRTWPEPARPRGAAAFLEVRLVPAEAIAASAGTASARSVAPIDPLAMAIDPDTKVPIVLARPTRAGRAPQATQETAGARPRQPVVGARVALRAAPPVPSPPATPSVVRTTDRRMLSDAATTERTPLTNQATTERTPLSHPATTDQPPRSDAAETDRAPVFDPVATGVPPRADPSATTASEAAPVDVDPADGAPTYRARPPPRATLVFALRRGADAGTARLEWQPDADGYALTLEGAGPAGPLLAFTSRGGFDTAGLAPSRYTDRRGRRSTLAINFQRDSGRVGFSASRRALALRAGEQDRISWLVQLGAIRAAEPGLREPGAVVALPVAGLRGDSGTWHFRVIGIDDVSTGSGTVPALKLQRASPGGYDPSVEAWFDPARHHLPVRLVVGNGVPGQALELLLQDMTIEP
jgi:hypothetical protein